VHRVNGRAGEVCGSSIRAYCPPIRRHLRPLSAVISGGPLRHAGLPARVGNDGRCSVQGWRRVSDVSRSTRPDNARIDTFRMSGRVPQVFPILIGTSVLHRDPRHGRHVSRRVRPLPVCGGTRGTRSCQFFPPRRARFQTRLRAVRFN